MNPEWKAKWIAALRSGKYKQGFHYLRSENNGSAEYCCLGVLHEIMGGSFDRSGLPATGWLPPKTARAAGLPVPQHPVFDWSPNNLQRVLADMNDVGKTFAEIADWIEKRL